MRRLLFVIVGLLGGLVGPAFSECQCPGTSAKAQMEEATYVFNAEVWDVAFDKPGGKKVITLDVNDIFKGKPESRLEVREAQDGRDCAIDFHEGESYLVFARWQWGNTLTSRCWGTKRLEQVGAEAANLGPSSAAKGRYYEKMRVHCMGRRDTPCCLASVKAIQDGGFLPQADEGCPDEMIPDRLRCDGSYIWCVPATEPQRHNQK